VEGAIYYSGDSDLSDTIPAISPELSETVDEKLLQTPHSIILILIGTAIGAFWREIFNFGYFLVTKK
jgi:hypothetical protein